MLDLLYMIKLENLDYDLTFIYYIVKFLKLDTSENLIFPFIYIYDYLLMFDLNLKLINIILNYFKKNNLILYSI